MRRGPVFPLGMARVSALVLATLSLAGCIAWEQAWDGAARRDCSRLPNTDDRQSCLHRVDDLIYDREAVLRPGDSP